MTCLSIGIKHFRFVKSIGKTNFRSERYYRKWTQSAESDYSEMLEKILEDVQREQEQKEKQTERVSNLTDEEKRCTIQQDAQKRMENAMAIRGVNI